MTHPEHICPFNDGEQSCDCYDEGYRQAVAGSNEKLVRVAENERERIRRWAIAYNETMVKHYGTDKHGISLEDLLEQLDA